VLCSSFRPGGGWKKEGERGNDQQTAQSLIAAWRKDSRKFKEGEREKEKGGFLFLPTVFQFPGEGGKGKGEEKRRHQDSNRLPSVTGKEARQREGEREGEPSPRPPSGT